ncbi:hypothetical protein IE81DRAFT_171696 [Ceraceosorus guamensis]|uniref:Secreted protein n=1 Tax=Ceraceosorus guamensis TaxID=1522189 RepID=A0A316W1L4_9BASI|nr:hypothetical protein IE81DRAFT_171696 [Ceraceosorus guamensis]PWN41555.1 hypothetical protein IE81DRAFT_171696 [Ceraceosorus guamensis]
MFMIAIGAIFTIQVRALCTAATFVIDGAPHALATRMANHSSDLQDSIDIIQASSRPSDVLGSADRPSSSHRRKQRKLCKLP